MPKPPRAFQGSTGSDQLDALAALKRHDAMDNPNQDRAELVQEAANAAWVLFIQRDHLGLKTDHHLLSTYEIPKDVMARVGVFAKKD